MRTGEHSGGRNGGGHGSRRLRGERAPAGADRIPAIAATAPNRPDGDVRTLRLRRRTLPGARLLGILLLLLAALWSGALAARITRASGLEGRGAEPQATLAQRELEPSGVHARADLGDLDATLAAVRDTVEYRRALADATPGLWPVRGWISSYFGLRRSPISGRTLMHTGLDLVAPYRTPVSAAAPGVVAAAGWSSEGYGYHVIVEHGFGFTTLYAHLSEIRVEEGSWVGRGETVGLLGTTGLSTGPHLHFEVRRSGAPVDPLEILAPLPAS